MKRKGFTLIEIIAALAIFSILIASITLGFSVSTRTWKSGEVKLKTMGYSQGIAEAFKAAGKAKLLAKLEADTNCSAFIYFDDNYENLWIYYTDGTGEHLDNAFNTFPGWYNSAQKLKGFVSKDGFIESNSLVTDDLLYQKATDIRANKGIKTKYGAYISARKETSNTDLYYFRVKTWDFTFGKGSESIREIFIR